MKIHDFPKHVQLILISIGLFCISCNVREAEENAIRQHPDNPHYMIFRGQPTALITLAEHYAAVINLDFDYIPYLNELHNRGFNLTRLFAYWRNNNDAHIAKNGSNSHLGAKGITQYCAPWEWSSETGGFDGKKFDLNKWNPPYFDRLKDFIAQASSRGIIVEVVLFSRPYDAEAWKADALNSANNTIEGIGVSHHFISQTLENEILLTKQKEYVTKIVRELRAFDNVYFEICNEPAVKSQMIDAGLSHGDLWKWHQEMINTIKTAEKELPDAQKHMIAINPMHGHREEWDDYINFNDIHIINRHYNNALANIWGSVKGDNEDYLRDKICSLDEGAYIDVPHDGHTHHTIPDQQVVEGWRYMASGGGVYNGLAKYVYLLNNPSGNTPGGIQLKGYFQILISNFNRLDFINMSQDKNVVISGIPDKADWRAIGDPGKQYLIYISHGHNQGYGLYVLDPGNHQIDLKLNLAGASSGSYRLEWMNIRNGNMVETEIISHPNTGEIAIKSPMYESDIALFIISE